MMQVKLVKNEKEKLQIRIIGVQAAYVNALRRYFQFEVPTMAIEDVEFRANNGILYDEMIAHRVGLLPLKTDLQSYNLKNECKCKGTGCAQCELKLTLKTVGPKTVYAADLKSKDPKVKPVFPQTPITKLLDGQELTFEATAVLGLGKEHSKWSTGLVFYKDNPTITIKKQPINAEEVMKRCNKAFLERKTDWKYKFKV